MQHGTCMKHPLNYLIMEFMDHSVEDYLNNNEEYKTKLLGQIYVMMVECLRELHTAGFIHRDIKP